MRKTTTEGPASFKILVPDPIAGQIGVIAVINANVPTPPARAFGPPPPPPPYAVQLALRLKVENRRITEAEHIYATIGGGKIHEIEAMGFTLPLYSKNGWSPFLR